MKKVSFILLFVSVCVFVYSQTPVENQIASPVITFTKTTHDFGDVPDTQGEVSYTFEVTNTGKSDLLISNAQGSCGCAVSEWTKKPINPGKKGFVKVTYKTENRTGAFQKTVTVSNNTANSPVQLFIKGNVVNAVASNNLPETNR